MKADGIAHAVIISAGQEWSAVLDTFGAGAAQTSPLGDWFVQKIHVGDGSQSVLFFHGGWGKIAAAASAQYVIDRWRPSLLVNLGTCGGFEGAIQVGEIVLVEKAIVYDIVEQMGDPAAAIARYTTSLDLSWLREPYPHAVRRTLIVSGDRDLVVEDIPMLQSTYGAVAGDWESGAIAWVAQRNGVRCLILRGVTDLVGPGGGEAYDGTVGLFTQRAAVLMRQLVDALPGWLDADGRRPTTDI